MSSLTAKTRIVYTPIIYDMDDRVVCEGGDYIYEECALQDAADLVSAHVTNNPKFYYARIEKRVVLIYGE
jgi:hypothetical protein